MAPRLTLCGLTLLLLAGCATPRGVQMEKRSSSAEFGPWSTSDQAPVVASADHSGGSTRVASREDGLLDFVFTGYSRYLTRIDGPRCEHRPTCSYYAILAMKRHGYVVGSLLTIDRLLRGRRSSVLRELDLYKIEDGVRYVHDPVSNNDFFF